MPVSFLKITLIILLGYLCGHNLSAQTQVHEFSYYFNNIPQAVRRFDDGRTLLVIEGEKYPSANGTYYFIVLKPDGTLDIQREFNFPKNGTVATMVSDAHTCADSGFVVVFAMGGCDHGPVYRSIQKFDKEYNYQWGLLDRHFFLPPTFIKDTDNHLIGLNYQNLTKYNYKTGAVIWKRKFVADAFFVPSMYSYNQNSNEILGENWAFNLWTYKSSSQQYVRTKEISVEDYIGLSEGIYPIESGKWIVWAKYGIRMINSANVQVVTWKPNQDTIFDFKLVNASLAYALTWRDSTSRILQLNLNNRTLDTIWEQTDSLKTMQSFWINGNDKVLAGIRGGGNNRDLIPTYRSIEQYNSRGAHVLHNTSNTAAQLPLSSVALLSVRQKTLLDTTQHISMYDTVYSTTGGNFDVLIRNTGNEIIKNVSVQTSFNFSAGICYTRGALHRRFKNMDLLPGDSTWLNFGDISINYQDSLYQDICFWTSAPNNQPDIFPENDLYCHVARYKNQPDFIPAQISIQPNPASQYVELIGPGKTANFRVYNHTGALILQDDIPAGAYSHRFDVGAWRPGVYFVLTGSQRLSFLVHH